MINTFVNPVVNPEAKLGVSTFDETDPVRLWQEHSEAEVDIVIRAVYRQVLGNAHVMESERLTAAESQLKQGEISVRQFVRQVANSAFYRSRFFENCPRYRAIELNFKHLLGRAPESYEETTAHSQLLDTAGYEAEIDSYIDSDEYQETFGEDTVPYYRGHKTQVGKKMVGFTHMFQLLRGASASDKDVTSRERSRLTGSLMTNTPSPIVPPSNLPAHWRPTNTASYSGGFQRRSLSGNASGQPEPIFTSRDRQQQYQAYQAFDNAPVELRSGASDADIDIIIRAAYRQVLGNAYVMESERLTVPESLLKNRSISVREFVRQVAQSELYRSRFFDNCYRYRAIELNFKHLLGRAPDNFDEMRSHSAMLDEGGFEAEINSYLDSDEYQIAFGENIVPYYRGYKTQNGQSMLEFTNMLQLLRSASSSDKDLTFGNKPRLTRSIVLNRAYGLERPRDASDILAELFSKPAQPVAPAPIAPVVPAAEQALQQKYREQEALIDSLQQQISELRPFASLGSAVTRQGQFATATGDAAFTSVTSRSLADSDLQRQVSEQAALIDSLQGELAEARSLAAIGEARLNRWQQRTFF